MDVHRSEAVTRAARMLEAARSALALADPDDLDLALAREDLALAALRRALQEAGHRKADGVVLPWMARRPPGR